MNFLLSAGEASSDLYGAQLIVALRRRARAADEPVAFMGVGGEKMRAAGCEIVVQAQHLAVVGMTEILSHLPKIYGEFRKLLRVVDALPRKPDAAIVIDSPAFNFRVARALHQRGIPVIYFVAPQLWAWRQYRVKRMQRWIRKVLCIFPFEEGFYREHGVEVEYVGHPLADLAEPAISRAAYAQQNGLDAAATWVALLPGSRKKEVRATLRTMLEAATLLAPATNVRNHYQFIIPNLDASWMRMEIARAERQSKASDLELVQFVPVDNARAALFHARAAVVASGTATVEAALMGCPFVTVYRLSRLTFRAAKKLVKVPYVAMPNLIAGSRIVPELLQEDFTPQKVASALKEILADGTAREEMLHDLAAVVSKLKFQPTGKQATTAIERAADAVMRVLPSKTEY
jgi:lipid-A-disaccharide synthase